MSADVRQIPGRFGRLESVLAGLAAFNVLAMASIGLFLLPATLLLLVLAVARSVRA